MPKINLNNLEIRTCNSNDVKDIYNIQEIVINNFKKEEKGYFLPFTEEWYLRIVNNPDKDGEIYGAFCNNKMIAWIFLSVSTRMEQIKSFIPNIDGKCADIDGVIVLPEYRGNALQKILVNYLESKAKEKGITNIVAEVTFGNDFSLNNLQSLGYEIKTWYQKDENIKIERVKITNFEGQKAIGKPIGNYITIDIKKLKIAQDEDIEKSAEILSKELTKILDLHVDKQGEILVVGLGNIYVTPDSLGPKVVNDIEVTRHIINYLPQYVEEGTRMVSAISPGVLGTTGIETVEILKGIVDNIHPKLVIVIDALASRSIERISSTIQLSDTGIVPGAGVGNKRAEISMKTLGIPVIAIGIPTCVETAVLVNDCLDLFITKLQQEAKSNEYLNELKEQDNYEEIKEALIPGDFNLIVTPKEIDDLIENMTEVVAKGINMSM